MHPYRKVPTKARPRKDSVRPGYSPAGYYGFDSWAYPVSSIRVWGNTSITVYGGTISAIGWFPRGKKVRNSKRNKVKYSRK